MTSKVCRRCGDQKEAGSFSPSKQNRDGLKSYCKLCSADLARMSRQSPEDRERLNSIRRSRRAAGHRADYEVSGSRRITQQVWGANDSAKKWSEKPQRITRDDWISVIDEFGGSCGYCGVKTADLWIDHRVPLSRGGPNARSNVVPSCESCNRRKSKRSVDQFMSGRCHRDHPLTEGNLYVDPRTGTRACRACRRMASQAYKRRKKESASGEAP